MGTVRYSLSQSELCLFIQTACGKSMAGSVLCDQKQAAKGRFDLTFVRAMSEMRLACLPRAVRFRRAPLGGLEEIEATILSDRAIAKVHRNSSMIPLRPMSSLSRKERSSSVPASSRRTRCASATLQARKLLSVLSMGSCISPDGMTGRLATQKICAGSRNRFSKWRARMVCSRDQ